MVSEVGCVFKSSTGSLGVSMLCKGVSTKARCPTQMPNSIDCSGVTNVPSSPSFSHARGSQKLREESVECVLSDRFCIVLFHINLSLREGIQAVFGIT